MFTFASFIVGSTGSRIQCFNFEWRPVRPYMHLVSDCFGQVTPGLSYYAAYPARSVEGIDTLIQQIRECIPHRFWHSSPIELKATAGLRLLPFKLADEIMLHISTYLHSTPFVVKSHDAVAIMDGTDEAVYAWISVNYLKRILHETYLPSPPHHSRSTTAIPSAQQSMPAEIREQTYGIVDLGGGSVQIAFAPILKSTLDIPDPRPFMHGVRVFGEGFKLYAYSYLGLGLQSARFRLFDRQEDPNALMEPTDRFLRSPCIHPEARIPWRHTDSDFILSGLNESEHIGGVDSRYSFARCYKEAAFLFSSHIRHEDEVPMETFYGLSYLYTKAVEAEIIGVGVEEAVVLACDWLDAAKKFCDKDRPLDDGRPLMCMDLVLISAMLLDGFGFECNTPIILATRIDNIEVSWSLGAVFHTLNTYHNTSHLHWQRSF